MPSTNLTSEYAFHQKDGWKDMEIFRYDDNYQPNFIRLETGTQTIRSIEKDTTNREKREKEIEGRRKEILECIKEPIIESNKEQFFTLLDKCTIIFVKGWKEKTTPIEIREEIDEKLEHCSKLYEELSNLICLSADLKDFLNNKYITIQGESDAELLMNGKTEEINNLWDTIVSALTGIEKELNHSRNSVNKYIKPGNSPNLLYTQFIKEIANLYEFLTGKAGKRKSDEEGPIHDLLYKITNIIDRDFQINTKQSCDGIIKKVLSSNKAEKEKEDAPSS